MTAPSLPQDSVVSGGEALTSCVAGTIFVELLEPALGPREPVCFPSGHAAGGPVAAGLYPGDERKGQERVLQSRSLFPCYKTQNVLGP